MTHITPRCVCYRCVMIYRKFNIRTTHSAGARPPCGKVGSRDRYVHVSDLADATSLGARRAAMQASDAWFGSAGSISFIPPPRLPCHFVGRKHPRKWRNSCPQGVAPPGRRSRVLAKASSSSRVAARAIWHHRAMLEAGAGDPRLCLEAVHSRLRAAQVISDCSVWRHVYSKRLLVAEHARGPAAGSPHFLSCLIERFPS